VCLLPKKISVPSKRVETLPPVDTATSTDQLVKFQYPQSGSRRCRSPLAGKLTPLASNFSTLKAGRDAAADPVILPLLLTIDFSTLKAGRDAAAAGVLKRCTPI